MMTPSAEEALEKYREINMHPMVVDSFRRMSVDDRLELLLHMVMHASSTLNALQAMSEVNEMTEQ